jgi:hypothetical protein
MEIFSFKVFYGWSVLLLLLLIFCFVFVFVFVFFFCLLFLFFVLLYYFRYLVLDVCIDIGFIFNSDAHCAVHICHVFVSLHVSKFNLNSDLFTMSFLKLKQYLNTIWNLSWLWRGINEGPSAASGLYFSTRDI